MELTEIRKYADNLISEHLNSNWRFKIVSNRNKKLFGRCVETFNGGIIEVTMYHCIHSSPEEIKDTIAHEIAHAIAGNHNGHNEVWREAARKVGAKPEQYADNDAIMYRYYLVHEESHTVVDRAQSSRVKWVRTPEAFYVNDIPNSLGNLKVLTYEEAKSKNYIN